MTPEFAAWHATAMRLAYEYADEYADDKMTCRDRPSPNREAARAALSAHLLAVPMGRVSAFAHSADPSRAISTTEREKSLLSRRTSGLAEWYTIPLYLHPNPPPTTHKEQTP